MDVSRRGLRRFGPWEFGLLAILILGLVLRLRGIGSPLLDHPGWRQGDTGAIARNFATLEYNIFRPQADYNGPPPNYVELELQIVPFIAATLYKIFGVHEIFGRSISMCFSLATVALLAQFGRWLFRSTAAGLTAALLFATYPGSVYYGRTFMPDSAMVFFLTAALYVTTRYLVEQKAASWRGFGLAALLLALALLAKPVAIVALVPVGVVMLARFGLRGALLRPQHAILFATALVPLWLYDRSISEVAEWHWASGITQLHVLPALQTAFSSPQAFREKLADTWTVLQMLPGTMLGTTAWIAFLAALIVPVKSRSPGLQFGWLFGALVYAFVVVTVERVDYYLYLFLPLAALWTGGSIAWLIARLPRPSPLRSVATAVLLGLTIPYVISNRQLMTPYYRYSGGVYERAVALDRTLDRNALVVMGHYDPSVLYYINRKGWEEDPLLWRPFDQHSAIEKGARYYISIEHDRLKRNPDLYEWLSGFPIVDPAARWPVYETAYAKRLPGAEQRWRARHGDELGQGSGSSDPPTPAGASGARPAVPVSTSLR